jgi:hypothetical protein
VLKKRVEEREVELRYGRKVGRTKGPKNGRTEERKD